MRIAIKIKSVSMAKVFAIQSCPTIMKTLLAVIPVVIRSNDDLTKTFASPVSFLAKLFPKKRCKPF